MGQGKKKEVQDLIEEYKKRIEKELGSKTYNPKIASKEYEIFKKESMPRPLTLYEKL